MTNVIHIEGGPFVIGRRLRNDASEWEMLERGFTTRDEALAYVNAYIGENYEWSIISLDELNPIDRRSITNTPH